MIKNIYVPQIAVIRDIKKETPDIKTFTLVFKSKKWGKAFSFRPGQFMMVSVFHSGEVPVSISSSPTRTGSLDLSIKRVGALTTKIHGCRVGEEIGLRGPYGRSFPLDESRGKNLLFIGGGIGLAPLRGFIDHSLQKRSEFGCITILHGAKSPADIPFKKELTEWGRKEDTRVFITVDRPDSSWNGPVGPVTTLWDRAAVSSRETMAIISGPPVMISFVMSDLCRMGFSEDDIVSTLERRMKCGVGKCGQCRIGDKLVCMDGPVFSFKEMKELPRDL